MSKTTLEGLDYVLGEDGLRIMKFGEHVVVEVLTACSSVDDDDFGEYCVVMRFEMINCDDKYITGPTGLQE